MPKQITGETSKWAAAFLTLTNRVSHNAMPETPIKNSHCSYCGHRYPIGLAWPRRCPHCGNVSYQNPLPVAVLLLPVGERGLLLVRRAIAPAAGQLALPGGFIELGESWQQAASRELWEETGIEADASAIMLYDTRSAPDGTLLVFGLAPHQTLEALPPFVLSDETLEVVIAEGPMDLAFSTHTETAGRYWHEHLN